MSDISFEPEPLLMLARLELLQGILPNDTADQRRQLYDRFGGPEDRWASKARIAYSAMSHMQGFVASVGDELSCELDIRENPELYAAVGGFDVSKITQGLGGWWSPSATWFQSGRTLAAEAQLADPAFEDFEEMARLLIEAGAHVLATFFSAVATGGLGVIDGGGWLRRRQRKTFAFMAEVARRRGMLFRDGPDEDGHYLHEEYISEEEILHVVKRSRAERRSRARVIP